MRGRGQVCKTKNFVPRRTAQLGLYSPHKARTSGQSKNLAAGNEWKGGAGIYLAAARMLEPKRAEALPANVGVRTPAP